MDEGRTIQDRGRRRRVLLVLAACVLLGICVVAFWPWEREPEYNGKKLSEWLREYKQPLGAMAPAISQEAASAVRQIGTNALPFLIKWIQADEEMPKWKTKLIHNAYKWNSLYARNKAIEIIAQRQLRARRATFGFEILGQDARAAIPELILVARNGNELSTSEAFTALSYVGKDSIPPLLALANDRDSERRVQAISALSDEMRRLGADTHTVVVCLTNHLKDPDPAIVRVAANLLGTYNLEYEISVPALAELMQSSDAGIRERGVNNLGFFGDRARSVLPQVLAALRDSNGDVRRSATNALRKIAPEKEF